MYTWSDVCPLIQNAGASWMISGVRFVCVSNDILDLPFVTTMGPSCVLCGRVVLDEYAVLLLLRFTDASTQNMGGLFRVLAWGVRRCRCVCVSPKTHGLLRMRTF